MPGSYNVHTQTHVFLLLFVLWHTHTHCFPILQMLQYKSV